MNGDRRRSELFIIARFHAREGLQDAVAKILEDEVVASQADIGCLTHEAYRSTRDPRLFFIHSHWSNEAAFEAHVKLPHTVLFVERIQPLIDHGFDIERAQSL